MAAKEKTSVALAGFDDSVGAKKSHLTNNIMPSEILALHENNGRAPVYFLSKEFGDLPKFAKHKCFGGKDEFCFSRAQVEARLVNLVETAKIQPRESTGQIQPVGVYRSNRNKPILKFGFLRHAAALLLELRDELDTARMSKGLRCETATHPTTTEGHLASAFVNNFENDERLDPSPLDLAWQFMQLRTLGAKNEDITARRGYSPSFIEKRIRLLSLPFSTRLAVHERRMTVDQALRQASERGEGTARGPDKGVKKSEVMRALASPPRERPQPDKSLTPRQVAELFSAMYGAVELEKTSEPVQAWVAWAKCPKPEKAAAPPTNIDENGESKPKRGRKPKTAPPQTARSEHADGH